MSLNLPNVPQTEPAVVDIWEDEGVVWYTRRDLTSRSGSWLPRGRRLGGRSWYYSERPDDMSAEIAERR